MAALHFREATREDEDVLLPMMRHLDEAGRSMGKFDEAAVRSAFRKFLSLPTFGRVWLFFAGQEPAGYIVLTIGFSFEFHGHDSFIDELYVEQPCRRRGYGRQAVAFLEAQARELGVNAVHLEVDEGNDIAFELYKRAGFEAHDRYLMTKWLQDKSQ